MQTEHAKSTIGKKTLFRKLMFYLIASAVLMAFFSTVIFYFIGGEIYGRQVLNELIPRANSVADIMTDYYSGEISNNSMRRVVFGKRGRDLGIILYDQNGKVIEENTHRDSIQGKNELNDRTPREIPNTVDHLANRVLAEKIELTLTQMDIAAIGVPVFDEAKNVKCVVISMKPAVELRNALRSLISALVISCVIVSFFMMIFAYIGSKKISSPIKQMEMIAIKMAQGDFSLRADVSSDNEIGNLGLALNSLSEGLSDSIRDLNREREKLNRILDTLREGVLSFEGDRLNYANPAAFELFAVNAEKDIAWTELIPDFFVNCRRAVTENVEISVTFPINDKVLGISFMKQNRFDETDNGIVVLVRDITEAERLEQTRKDYVANVSHELKTPITSIRSLAETLNDGMIKNEEDRSRYYSYILREAVRMGLLINELLELSRLQAGTLALEKQDFSLDELLSSVTERMRVTAEYSGLTLNYRSEEKVIVFSNRSRIEQVLVCIIDNAIKYCTDGGTIDVGYRCNDCNAEVYIRNTGSVRKEDIPYLFDRFYKADRSHKGNGTGLGLAITKELLDRLGESIRVETDSKTVTFTFTLRLQKPDMP